MGDGSLMLRAGVAPIVSLLEIGSPTAITGFVVPVHVNTVDAGAIGPWPHVLKEVIKSELPKPPLAHGDTSAPIVRKFPVSWIKTALLHSAPRGVLARVSQWPECSTGNNWVSVSAPPLPMVNAESTTPRDAVTSLHRTNVNWRKNRDKWRGSSAERDQRIPVDSPSRIVALAHRALTRRVQTAFNRAGDWSNLRTHREQNLPVSRGRTLARRGLFSCLHFTTLTVPGC